MSRLYLAREGGIRKYVWLKAVTGVHPDQHCARALAGSYLPVDRTAEVQQIALPCNRGTAAIPALYFCGVTDPFCYPSNDHVLLLPAPGESHSVYTPGYVLDVVGWRPQPFGVADIPPGEPLAARRPYATCRCWQAAHWLRTHRVVPSADATPAHPRS